MFTRDDARWLADTVAGLYAARSPRQLAGAGIEAVYRRFRLVASGFEEISYDHALYTVHDARCAFAPPADHAAFIHDHPAAGIVTPRGDREFFHVRQLVSLRQWQETDNYNGIAKPMGYADQISVVAYNPTAFLAFGIFRDTMFSGAESALMALLQVHLQAAWQRVSFDSLSVQTGFPASLALTARLQPVEIGLRHRALLRRYFPNWREPDELPEELRAWVVASLRQLRQPLPPRPLRAFVTGSAHGRLLVRCFPNPDSGAAALHLTESLHVPSFLDLRRRGLTSRECEVLHWIAQGKRDAEIGRILGCAPRTIGKHVENLLVKLHAGNRGSAVGVASDWLGAC